MVETRPSAARSRRRDAGTVPATAFTIHKSLETVPPAAVRAEAAARELVREVTIIGSVPARLAKAGSKKAGEEVFCGVLRSTVGRGARAEGTAHPASPNPNS